MEQSRQQEFDQMRSFGARDDIDERINNFGRRVRSKWLDGIKKCVLSAREQFLASERAKATVYPAQEDVWSWTPRTHIQDVKVVI